MAQWEKRDPRWHVKELGTSGSNVNGWHWEEKSKMSWARDRLQALIQNIDSNIKPERGTAKILGMKELTGDAYLTRRKGNKTMIVYDLSLTLQWEGTLASEKKRVSGTMKITEICLGSEEEDYIVTVASDKDDEKYKCLVEAIRELQPLVVKLLLQFDNEIKGLQQ